MPEAIWTARLLLRPMQSGDADGLHRVFSDPVAMQYFDDVHRDISASRDWVERTVAAPPEKTREFALIEDGDVIGKAGIWMAPELGFMLRRDRWGHGLMQEALAALLPHLFAVLSLPRITADVDPRNIASLRLLTGLGFAETGGAKATIRIAGNWCDSIYLACAAPES